MPQDPTQSWLDSRIKPLQPVRMKTRTRKEPTWTQSLVAGGLRTVPALAGGALGWLAGLPTGPGSLATGALGGAAGGGIGESLAEMYEKAQGLRDEINPTQIAVQTALGTLPGFTKAPGVGTGLKELGKYALKMGGEGALMNAASEFPTEWAETGGLPSVRQVASSAGIGGVMGAGVGGALGRYGQTRPQPVVPPVTPLPPSIPTTNKLNYSMADMNGPAPPPSVTLGQPQSPIARPTGSILAQGIQPPVQPPVQPPPIVQPPVTQPTMPPTGPSIPMGRPIGPVQPPPIQRPGVAPNIPPAPPAVDTSVLQNTPLAPTVAPTQPVVQKLPPAAAGKPAVSFKAIQKELSERYPGISISDAKRFKEAEDAIESADYDPRATGVDAESDSVMRMGARGEGAQFQADYIPPNLRKAKEDFETLTDELELKYGENRFTSTTVSKAAGPEQKSNIVAPVGKKGAAALAKLKKWEDEGFGTGEKKPADRTRNVSPAREKYVVSKIKTLLKAATDLGDESGINTYKRLLNRVTNPDLDIPGKYGFAGNEAKPLDMFDESDWNHLQDQLEYPGISADESNQLRQERRRGLREFDDPDLAGGEKAVKEARRQRTKDDLRENYPRPDEDQNKAYANVDRITGEIIEPDVKESTLEPYGKRVSKITKYFPEITDGELRNVTNAQTHIDHLERTGQDATKEKARLKDYSVKLKEKYGTPRPIDDSEAPRDRSNQKAEDRVLEPETLELRNVMPNASQEDILKHDMYVKRVKKSSDPQQKSARLAELEAFKEDVKRRLGAVTQVRERVAKSDAPITLRKKGKKEKSVGSMSLVDKRVNESGVDTSVVPEDVIKTAPKDDDFDPADPWDGLEDDVRDIDYDESPASFNDNKDLKKYKRDAYYNWNGISEVDSMEYALLRDSLSRATGDMDVRSQAVLHEELTKLHAHLTEKYSGRPAKKSDVDTSVVPEGAVKELDVVEPPSIKGDLKEEPHKFVEGERSALEEPALPPTSARAKVSMNEVMKSVALSVDERIDNIKNKFPGIPNPKVHRLLDAEDTLARVMSKRGGNLEAHAENYRALVNDFANKYKQGDPYIARQAFNNIMESARRIWPKISQTDAELYARLKSHYDSFPYGKGMSPERKAASSKLAEFEKQLDRRMVGEGNYIDPSTPAKGDVDTSIVPADDFDPDLDEPPPTARKKKSAKEVRAKSQETQKGKRKGKAGKGGSKAMAAEDSDRVVKSDIIPESELIHGDGEEDVLDEINKIVLDETPDDGTKQPDLFDEDISGKKAAPKVEEPAAVKVDTLEEEDPIKAIIAATGDGGSTGSGGGGTTTTGGGATPPPGGKKPINLRGPKQVLAKIVGKVGTTLRNTAFYDKFMEQNPELKKIMDPFIKRRSATKLRGEAVRKKFKHLAKYSVDDILKFEDEYHKGQHPEVHKYFEDIYDVLMKNGVPVEHRGRYLPQRWKNWEDLKKRAGSKNIGMGKSTFQHQTDFVNYEHGMRNGMSPAYSPLELIEKYAEDASKKLADTTLIKQLRRSGYIIKKSKDVIRGTDVPEHFERFDKEISGLGKYYADPSVRRVINNYLSDSSGNLFSKFDKAMGKIANTMLSAGVPFVPALTYRGQSIARPFTGRAWLADGIRGQIDAIRLGVGTKKANKVLEADAEMRASFATKAGYTDTTVDVPPTAHFFEEPGNSKIKKAFNKITGAQYKMFEKPLLESYVPALKWLSTKRFYEKALKSGMSDAKAMEAAVKHGNDHFGGHNLDLLYNNKDFNTSMRMTFLSPSWLRTNMAMGKGMVQALNPRSTMPKVERKQYLATYGKLVGAYVAGNMLQKSLTGKYMAENEPGHKFDLVVGKDSLGRERRTKLFNTSADAFELAGEMAGSTMEAFGGHEYANPLSELSSYFTNRTSVPLGMAKGIATGSDYMGRPNLAAKIGRYGEPVDMWNATANTAFQALNYGPQQIAAPITWGSGFIPGMEQRTSFEEMGSRLGELGISYGKGPKAKGSGKGKQFGSGMKVLQPSMMKKMGK